MPFPGVGEKALSIPRTIGERETDFYRRKTKSGERNCMSKLCSLLTTERGASQLTWKDYINGVFDSSANQQDLDALHHMLTIMSERFSGYYDEFVPQMTLTYKSKMIALLYRLAACNEPNALKLGFELVYRLTSPVRCAQFEDLEFSELLYLKRLHIVDRLIDQFVDLGDASSVYALIDALSGWGVFSLQGDVDDHDNNHLFELKTRMATYFKESFLSSSWVDLCLNYVSSQAQHARQNDAQRKLNRLQRLFDLKALSLSEFGLAESVQVENGRYDSAFLSWRAVCKLIWTELLRQDYIHPLDKYLSADSAPKKQRLHACYLLVGTLYYDSGSMDAFCKKLSEYGFLGDAVGGILKNKQVPSDYVACLFRHVKPYIQHLSVLNFDSNSLKQFIKMISPGPKDRVTRDWLLNKDPLSKGGESRFVVLARQSMMAAYELFRRYTYARADRQAWLARSGFLEFDSLRDRLGNNLLHIAVRAQDQGIAKLLIESGVNVNAKNNSGNTPLHYVCSFDPYKLSQIIERKEALFKPISKSLGATKGANLAVLLLEHEAIVNEANNSGYTFLDLLIDYSLQTYDYTIARKVVDLVVEHASFNSKEGWAGFMNRLNDAGLMDCVIPTSYPGESRSVMQMLVNAVYEFTDAFKSPCLQQFREIFADLPRDQKKGLRKEMRQHAVGSKRSRENGASCDYDAQTSTVTLSSVSNDLAYFKATRKFAKHDLGSHYDSDNQSEQTSDAEEAMTCSYR